MENFAIFDFGSTFTKFGITKEDPRIIQTIFGQPKLNSFMNSVLIQKDAYFGDEAIVKKGLLRFSFPIQNQLIKNFEKFERFLYHICLNEILISSDDYGFLLTNSIFESNIKKEKLIKIIFESFSVPFLCLKNQEELALYCNGKISGCVLNCGGDFTNCCCILEGSILKNSILQIKIGGNEITRIFLKILSEIGYSITTVEWELLRKLKENFGIISLNYEEEIKNENSNKYCKIYELPDGNLIEMNKERIKIGEILFNPKLFDLKYCGIHELIYNSIKIYEKEKEIKNFFSKNILICGGNSMFENFDERILKELNTNFDFDFNVIKNENKFFGSYFGGCLISSLSNFENFCISKKEFDENGENIMYRKFL